MAIRLTKNFVEDVLPGSTPKEYRDTRVPGLLLRVQPSGLKTWYVTRGRGQRRALPQPYPVTTVESARVRAIEMLGDDEAWLAKKGRPESVAVFLTKHYAPWVEAERRSGKATVARIKMAFADLMKRPLDAIGTKELDHWKSSRLRDGTKPATVNRDLTAIKAALAKATAWGMLESNRAAATKPAKVDDDKRIRYLSEAEETALRKALADRDRDMIEARDRTIAASRAQHDNLAPIPADGFGDLITPLVLTAINTGCRRGELTGLRWCDVDLVGRQITVRAATSKGAKTRRIPLNVEAEDTLQRWRRQCDGARVFAIQSPKKAWGALLERAGIVDFRFHDCRHHFASKLVMAGVPLAVIRDLLGHGSIVMTERYAHLAPRSMADAVALLGNAA